MYTMSSLRDVLEMKVSPTTVSHFVMNSSSDIGSHCKKLRASQKQKLARAGKKKNAC